MNIPLSNQPALILGVDSLTPAMARYWNALARKTSATVVDPFRQPLRKLRAEHPELIGFTVYRASTGGRYGKSKEIVRL